MTQESLKIKIYGANPTSYIKNINSIRLEGKIFNLNDGEFKKILEILNVKIK